MRVQVGKPLRVAIGDKIVIRARLPVGAALGRLFVFAREGENEEFSPYVHDMVAKIRAAGNDPFKLPPMLQPMALRLTSRNPLRVLQFTSDIDGCICVMQEVDTVRDLHVKLKFSRKIAPHLPWSQRLRRRVSELWA